MGKRKESAFNILREAFTGYFKNLNLSLPFLFLIIVALVLSFIFSFVSIDSIQNIQVNLTNILMILFIIVIFFLVLIYAYSFLVSGAIGMAVEVSNKKKPSLSTLLKTGKKFWARFFGVTILLLLITLIPFFLLVFIGNTLVQNLPVAAQLITLISITFIVVLLFVFVMLSPYFLIMKNIGIFAALKESLNFAKKRYADLLLITLIFVILEIIVNLIPFVGQIINLLIIAPIQTLTFALFITNKGKK